MGHSKGNESGADYTVELVPPVETYEPGTFVKSKWAPFVRNPYNYDTNAASDESGVRCDDPSLAVQAAKEDADINVIVERFGLTGKFPENPRVPSYGDFSGISDFRTALHAIEGAREMFMEYPASLRARFENDPQIFLEFCSLEENREEMSRLGLLKPVDPALKAAPVVVDSK